MFMLNKSLQGVRPKEWGPDPTSMFQANVHVVLSHKTHSFGTKGMGTCSYVWQKKGWESVGLFVVVL